jgi:hypothetical protein
MNLTTTHVTLLRFVIIYLIFVFFTLWLIIYNPHIMFEDNMRVYSAIIVILLPIVLLTIYCIMKYALNCCSKDSPPLPHPPNVPYPPDILLTTV